MKIIQVLLNNKITQKKLSIREAARQIGIAHTTLARVLDGHPIDLETHVDICNWLEIKPSTALDTYSSIQDALVPKIAVILEQSPSLAQKFEEIIMAIEQGIIEPGIIDEIITFIVFRLSIIQSDQRQP